VLDVGGVAAGYVLLISFWSNELGGEICNVDEPSVAQSLRSQGHASRLVESLMNAEGPWQGRPRAIEL